MLLSTKIKIVLLVLVCTTAITAATFRKQSHNAAQGQEAFQRRVPISIKRVLHGVDNYAVEILCGPAFLSTPSELEGFTCRLRNNGSENLLAANVTYSILLEEDGKEWTESRSHMLDAAVHPDFYDVGKSILPGAERPIEPPGPSAYGSALIKGVEIEVDYLEFEDGITLGNNGKAAQIIADIRDGAAAYKRWLAKKYIERGKSVEAIAPLIERDALLPNELANTRLEQGARVYRNRLRHIYETRGAAQVEARLEK